MQVGQDLGAKDFETLDNPTRVCLHDETKQYKSCVEKKRILQGQPSSFEIQKCNRRTYIENKTTILNRGNLWKGNIWLTIYDLVLLLNVSLLPLVHQIPGSGMLIDSELGSIRTGGC